VKAPKAPDPYATAQAQSQMNQQTAQFQQGLNMVNQNTPYGTLRYTGSNTGQPGAATATVNLTPIQQKLLDQTQQADLKQNNIALNQIDRVGGVLSQPVNLNNEATESRLMELGSKRLDPRFAREREGMEQELMNRGIRPGSAAYDSMVGNFNEGKNDAYNQLLLTGRAQATQEALTERNQPLNEITALLNGQQISLPQFQNTPQSQVANTDLAGLVQNAYNAKNQQYQANMGGLFGLGGSLIRGATSFGTGGLGGMKLW
jgi:hypothetical protein